MNDAMVNLRKEIAEKHGGPTAFALLHTVTLHSYMQLTMAAVPPEMRDELVRLSTGVMSTMFMEMSDLGLLTIDNARDFTAEAARIDDAMLAIFNSAPAN